MNESDTEEAFGAPGTEPRWTSSAKEGLGTSYHTGCRMWFTLSHGIVNEIYYPSVDQPNTRDFQFLVSDGKTFCHEEKRDFLHEMEYPERHCLLYRLVNTEREGRYRVVKQILTDPHRSVLLVHIRLEIVDESLRGRLRLYALLAPHIARQGKDNSGQCVEISATKILHAHRSSVHLMMAAAPGFVRRSVGYVGYSDGWQDLMRNFEMKWNFRRAEHGNIALTAELELDENGEATVGVAMGGSYQSTAAKLMQSLAPPFTQHRAAYVRQWQRTAINPDFDFPQDTTDGGHLYRLSRCILLSHEDKLFQGAMVASMSIPWGESKDDNDLGGYHLVWTRDLVQSAGALLATGQTGTPLRALIWLAAIQRADGSFPQNSWIDGSAYWSGQQLDEMAAPILLACRLHREGVLLGDFDPMVMILRAVRYLVLQGPVTGQERWEENSGFSPSTLATVIAGLVSAADLCQARGLGGTADFILAYADWLAAHVEEWTVTTEGELVEGIPRHFIRINPTDPSSPDTDADPNRTLLQVANGGGLHPARNIVGGDFLHLVRLGIRSPEDPLVRQSVTVLDRVLKRDLPQGPCWRRYNHDGYGQKADGTAFDGTGVGRSWPILTGERGHYELAAGRDPLPFISTIEKFANVGALLTEQLWDDDDLPGHWRKGEPTGAAMPLCWSHAEYVTLVRSRHEGVCFDRVEAAYQRYVAKPVASRHEFWEFRFPLRRMARGKILRVVLDSEATLVWTDDHWTSRKQVALQPESSLRLWYADLATADLEPAAVLEFTFIWHPEQRPEGRNWTVTIEG